MQEAPPPRKRGAVAVVTRGRELLVIRRSRTVAAPLAYCFPGGGIEAGETEEQAVVREMLEELGVEVTPIQRLWESRTPWGVHLCWWQVQIPDDALFVPSPAEVESVHWYAPSEMLRLAALLDSNRAFLAALAQGVFTLEGYVTDAIG